MYSFLESSHKKFLADENWIRSAVARSARLEVRWQKKTGEQPREMFGRRKLKSRDEHILGFHGFVSRFDFFTLF